MTVSRETGLLTAAIAERSRMLAEVVKLMDRVAELERRLKEEAALTLRLAHRVEVLEKEIRESGPFPRIAIVN